MKKKCVQLLILLLGAACYAQYSNGTKKDALPNALSYFSTSSSFTNLGNYVALSTANNTLNGSFYFLSKNDNMFTVSVEAGATQGIATVFDEGDLNTNASVGFEYRKLFSGEQNYLGYYNIPDLKLIKRDSVLVEDEYNLKRLALLERIEHSLNRKVDSANNTIFQKLGGKKIDVKLHSDISKNLKKVDSMLNKYDNMSLSEYEELPNHIKKMVTDLREYRKTLIDRASSNHKEVYALEWHKLIEDRNKKIKALENKRESMKPRYIKLNFLTFGYKASNSNFVRFLENEDIENQLKSTSYITHNLSFSYSYISNVKRKKNSRIEKDFDPIPYMFLTLGAKYSYTNNQNSLTQVEVVDTKYESIDDNRQVNQKQNAFIGDYKEGLSNYNVFIDYYSFFSKKSNFLAYHITPSLLIRENNKPVTTLQLGLLIPFKKKKDNKTSVNVELFYKIKDIFNTAGNTNSLLNRNIIGIQTSFPFNL